MQRTKTPTVTRSSSSAIMDKIGNSAEEPRISVSLMMDQASPADPMSAAGGEVTNQDLSRIDADLVDQVSDEHGATAEWSESDQMNAAGDSRVTTANAAAGPVGKFLADKSASIDLQTRDISTAHPGIAGGVRYGEPKDVEELATRIDKIKGWTKLPGEEGIILKDYQKMLQIVDGKYREKFEYSIVKRLGEGGFGEVYLIQDMQIKGKAVVKIIELEKFSPDEVVNWCSLIHESVVQFMGLIRIKSKIMLFMEYHEGYEVLEKCQGMELLPALHLIKHLFQALEYLHEEKGIVHNDFYMDNILYKCKDTPHPYPKIKLIDWGESKKTNDGSKDVKSAIVCTLFLFDLKDCKEFLDFDLQLKKFLEWATEKNNIPRASEVLPRIEDLIEKLESETAQPTGSGPPTGDYVPPKY